MLKTQEIKESIDVVHNLVNKIENRRNDFEKRIETELLKESLKDVEVKF